MSDVHIEALARYGNGRWRAYKSPSEGVTLRNTASMVLGPARDFDDLHGWKQQRLIIIFRVTIYANDLKQHRLATAALLARSKTWTCSSPLFRPTGLLYSRSRVV